MATHSSVLALRIPGTREPGGLPSTGSHSRIRLKRLSSSSSDLIFSNSQAKTIVSISIRLIKISKALLPFIWFLNNKYFCSF